MLHIYDCNNYIRRQYEVDKTGLVLRNLYYAALGRPAGSNIYVFDGYNAKAARRQVFPGYKVGRPKAPDEFYKTLNVAKKVLRCSPQFMAEIEGYEADDIIASIVRQAAGKVPITIFSNDGDFRTLCSGTVKMSDPMLTEVNAQEVRLYKTLVGDSSDKIPGFKGFGKTTWGELTEGQKSNWLMLLNEEQPKDLLGKLSHDALGIKLTQMPWLVLNLKDLQSYWLIVNFLDVPDELVDQHMQLGTRDSTKANMYLTEVMQ